jgi:predicted metal-dependent peptidase
MDKRVIRAKVHLMLEKPFFGSLCARLEVIEKDIKFMGRGDPTFATDGKHLFIPKGGKYPYTDVELLSVVAHETLHPALGHNYREGNRNHFMWNVACDFAINWILKQDGFSIPDTWCYDQKYAGMSAEKIYSLLPKSGNSGGKSKGQNGDGQWIPDFDDLLKPNQNKNGKNSAEGEDSSSSLDGDLECEWKEAMSHALQKNKGKYPAGLEEMIGEWLFPKIPWQQVLFRFLQASKGQQDFKAYPFNRNHIYRGLYLPSMCGDSIELCVGLDTSGSISTEDFTRYMSEVRGICSSFGEYVIYLYECDAAVQLEAEITADSDLPQVMKGRGGTSFVPVFKKIAKDERDHMPIVYFTDLCGDFPSERSDTFWCVKKRDSQYKVPFGEVIIIDED